MKNKIISEVRQTLIDCIDPKTQETSNRYFKEGEEAKVHGVKMGEVSKIGKAFYQEQIKDLPKKLVFDICEELWKSKYLEQSVIACIWTEAMCEQYEPADFDVFEHWVKDYVNNWADCDTLCNHTIGTFVMMYPQYISRLKEWAKSPERWVKRASAVTLIIPARKGLFLNDILEIADTLLLDKDDMVQKGYGWMLKAASMSEPTAAAKETDPEIKKKHLEAVFNYVISKRKVMPRTALRYAIEKMPQELRTEAMKK